MRVGEIGTELGRSFPGRAQAYQELNLSFRIGGPLIQFPVRVGEAVQKGQVLARIDPRDFDIGLRQAQGQLVMRLDPTDDDATPWNVLLEMPAYPHDVEFAQNLARALRPPLEEYQTRGDPHWELTADEFIAAIMLHVFYAESEQTLTRCWEVMVDPSRTVKKTCNIMAAINSSAVNSQCGSPRV